MVKRKRIRSRNLSLLKYRPLKVTERWKMVGTIKHVKNTFSMFSLNQPAKIASAAWSALTCSPLGSEYKGLSAAIAKPANGMTLVKIAFEKLDLVRSMYDDCSIPASTEASVGS